MCVYARGGTCAAAADQPEELRRVLVFPPRVHFGEGPLARAHEMGLMLLAPERTVVEGDESAVEGWRQRDYAGLRERRNDQGE